MDAGLSALRREVMAPRRPSSSFGLIAVSTLAMVFAVSSSLLLFSAHRHRERAERMMLHNTSAGDRHAVVVRTPERRAAPAKKTVRIPTPARVLAPDECKGPIYRPTPDGGTEVVFEQCAARPFAQE
jgi:hypothetical protein